MVRVTGVAAARDIAENLCAACLCVGFRFQHQRAAAFADDKAVAGHIKRTAGG